MKRPSPNYLPPQITSFIGRDEELAGIMERLIDASCRLLTVVGPGGVGKTRLAVEAAVQVADEFADGVHFVDLQAVEPTDFLSAVADALHLSLSGQNPPRAQLLNYLGGKEVLLLLDNFEHLLSKTPFLSEVVRQASGVKLLVTSREALHLQAEWCYPLAGLPVPPRSASGEAVRAYGAVQLFLERVRRVRPNFSLDNERSGVVRICRLVEGLPLALELAASWARTLPCNEIADEIECNLDFLATPLRDVPERHRSMQAVFDQSWALLSEEERTVFKRLSVFRGGFQRAAAEAVAGATLPILSTLVDKSMVRREDRYYVHELLRQFGEEKLQASPDEAEAVRQRHVEYYATFLHDRLEAINSTPQHRVATEIADELENVRAAWQRAVTDGNMDAIHSAASTFFYFCQLRSRFQEGAMALEAAATRIEQQPASRQRDLTLAQLFNHEGWLRIRVGEFDRARRLSEQSRALYGRLDAPPPPYMGGDSSVALAVTALIQGDDEWAVALCESARHAAAARGDKQNLAFAHYGLTAAKSAQGNYEAAYRHAERACALAEAAGNRWFLAYPLIEWGNVARAMDNYDEAEQHYRAGYALKEEFDDPEGMAVALSHLGEIAVLQEHYQEALQLFQQSLDLYADLNDRGGLATSHKGLGQVAHAMQDFPSASTRFRQALQIAAEIQFWPLLCSILVDAAALLGDLGQQALAVALLTLVQQHPSSDHETRNQAQQWLDAYEVEMVTTDFAAAVERGTQWKLDRALATLQTELSAATEDDRALAEPEQPLIEPLTERELDVLRLLAEGYTNPAIAEELVLAVGTVKWYASQIYGKLGVANRTEAAARARELGLLP